MNKINKIISFKYSVNEKGNLTIDSKELSVALDGINDLMLGILYKIKKEELDDEEMKLLKGEIEKEGKGIDISVQEGSIEISISLESIWNLLNDNAGGIVASRLFYSGLKEIFKKYKRKNEVTLLLKQPEEKNKEQIFDFIVNELRKINNGISQLKEKRKKSKPNSPFNKIIVPINVNVNFGLQIFKDNKVIDKNEIKNEDKYLFDHIKEHSLILPELQDGESVDITGKISRGSEKNEFNLRYKKVEIKCVAKGNMDGILFRKARVTGIVDRKYKTERVYKNEFDLENKPQVRNAEIHYSNDADSRKLFELDNA